MGLGMDTWSKLNQSILSLSEKLGSGSRASDCGENRGGINLSSGETAFPATGSKCRESLSEQSKKQLMGGKKLK